MTEIALHSVRYGFSNNWSVSAGSEVLTMFNKNIFDGKSGKGLPDFMYVAPRYSYSLCDWWHLSGSFLLGRDRESNFFDGAATNNRLTIANLTTTVGTRGAHFSVTYAHRFEKVPRNQPKLTSGLLTFVIEEQVQTFWSLAGLWRVHPRWVLVLETWHSEIFNDPVTLTTFGGKYLRPNYHLGVGILVPRARDVGDIFAVPFITFGIPLGQKW
jgi:hypothetical protein